VAIGRKNYLFIGSHNGAKWRVIFYLFLANVELNGLQPKSYLNLKELREILPDYPVNELKNLLPAN
jgi:hypothetical protein